jgi:hypothetical protein
MPFTHVLPVLAIQVERLDHVDVGIGDDSSIVQMVFAIGVGLEASHRTRRGIN